MAKSAEALLVITGSMGSGKTTVMAEASDLLAFEGVHHASIDLDALSAGHLPQTRHKVMFRNLRCVWENYWDLGARRLLLARAIETREELESCREAVSAAGVVVCRLTAGIKTMQERVRTREPGILQKRLVDRVQALKSILDNTRLEDFSIDNENRPVTEVARDMLLRAGWLPVKTP